MLPALVLLVIALLTTLAVGTGSPATDRTRAHDVARRARFLGRHPDQVNAGDVHHLLVEAGLSRDRISRTVDGARELGYTSFTMYAWIKRFDAETLGHIIDERISEHEALACVSDGTLPELETLAAFALSHDIATSPRVPSEDLRRLRNNPRPIRAAVRVPSSTQPSVFEPGDWSTEAVLVAVTAPGADGAPADLAPRGFAA